VLNDLQMPGELSEATFHNHPVEEAKLRNRDFRRLEALGLHFAFLDYFEAGGMPTGSISGIVRDAQTRKPINGARVILLPDSLEYVTDTWDNGLFAFHDLPPGHYQLFVEAPDYLNGTAETTLDSNSIRHVDFNLVSAIPPKVMAIKPKHETAGVAPFAKVFVKFSQSMDAESVQQAFRLEPPVEGTLLSDRQRLVFTFESFHGMQPGQTYTVTIASTARNAFGLPLDGNGDGMGGDAYAFRFSVAPLDTTVPMIIDIEPGRRVRNVDMNRPIRVQFSRPMKPGSAIWSQNVRVTSNRGKVSYRLDWPKGADQRWLTLIPNWPLQPDARVYITLRRSIKDANGAGLLEEVLWEYYTEPTSGNPETISDFRGDDNPFADPLSQPATRGLAADSLEMAIVKLPYYFVSGSLRLAARFSQPDGNLRLTFAAGDVFIDSTDVALVAVYGDSSGAWLRWLLHDAGQVLSLPVRMDWWGWRVLTYRAGVDSLFDENGQVRLQDRSRLRWLGFDIQPGDGRYVELYLDNLTVRKPENVVAVDGTSPLPRSFEVMLPQPNPVARTDRPVRIDFVLPAPQTVQVTVYDVLGRSLFSRELVRQRAGRHRFEWRWRTEDGRRVGPGVFFVQFKIQNRQVTRKIVLLP
ncbi:MAG: Ig-like domain-containing protein, partial [candidate division KSB1 bacterium]|nr:Ig-like domain-containing protein [candidate division KSB1 bacterium]